MSFLEKNRVFRAFLYLSLVTESEDYLILAWAPWRQHCVPWPCVSISALTGLAKGGAQMPVSFSSPRPAPWPRPLPSLPSLCLLANGKCWPLCSTFVVTSWLGSEESGCQDPVTAGVLRVKPLSSLTMIPQCAIDNQGCLIQQFYQAV